jgi:hypothetical protein
MLVEALFPEEGGAGDMAAVLGWRLSALAPTDPGPLLGSATAHSVETDLAPRYSTNPGADPVWGDYLTKRSHLVGDLADQVHGLVAAAFTHRDSRAGYPCSPVSGFASRGPAVSPLRAVSMIAGNAQAWPLVSGHYRSNRVSSVGICRPGSAATSQVDHDLGLM